MPFVTKYAWNILIPAIKKADIIIEVLDARNPQETRSRKIEKRVLGVDKKQLVFTLNKQDLVPKFVVKQWQSILSRIAPTLSISARYPSTLNRFMSSLNVILKSHPYWKGVDLKLRVLVVGYPNCGKSTLIQALTKNKKKVRSSSQAGFTRGLQLIKLSDKVYLIDTPGVIPPEKDDEIYQALNTCSIAPQKILDKETVVDEIFRRSSMDILNNIYKVNASDIDEFILLVGKRRGLLAKGGVIREDEVFKLLINDWQQSRIPHYRIPKQDDPESPGVLKVGKKK
ncbi:MAG: YlqF/YawG family GTPase [Promethearchaeota archaeon]